MVGFANSFIVIFCDFNYDAPQTYKAGECYKTLRRTIRNHLQADSLEKYWVKNPYSVTTRMLRFVEVELIVTLRIL